MTLRLFLLQPDIVFAARVNQASFSYPLAQVAFDDVTVGAYTDVQPGMTVLFGTSAGADDLGRSRIRKTPTSGVLYIGRSSRGTRDGEVDLQDDAYITVLDDFRVWAKIPYISEDGTIYKDHDLAVGAHTTTPPPVANTGPAMCGTVDPDTGVLTVTFDGSASFAVSGSITSYAWDARDGTITAGADAALMTAEFPPGFRWVALTVTDTNGNTHTARCPVFARDPDADECISAFHVESHTIRPEGQQLSLRIYEDIAGATYPDGTLVMLWEGEPSDPADRSHMTFIGWHHTDPADIRAERTATLGSVVLECRDVAGKLDSLPGFSQLLETSSNPSTWTEMVSPNMDKYLHYLLHWHSTALEVADWTWTGTTVAYPFVALGSDGESLYDQVDRRARALVPDHRLTCNRRGQLQMPVDPMLQNASSRTATVQVALDEGDWTSLAYTHQRAPRVHWLRGNAIVASQTQVQAVFCIAPGTSPGQGEIAQESGEQLTTSQEALNVVEGNRYARINAPEGPFTLTLRDGIADAIEPADLTWVTLTVSAATAAQRGLAFTAARGLPVELSIRYEHTRTGLVRTAELTWERETSGPAAMTYYPPTDEMDDLSLTPLPDFNFDFYIPPASEPGSGVGGIELTASPALYMATGQYVGRTREVGQANPSYERLFSYTTDFENTPIRRFALDPWDPKNRAYVLCGDINKDISLKLFEITNLNGPVGAQTITKVLDQPSSDLVAGSRNWFEFAFEASITMEGAVAILARLQHGGLGDWVGRHFVLTRTGYGGAWRKVDVGRHSFQGVAGFGLGQHGSNRIYTTIRDNDLVTLLRSDDFGLTWSTITNMSVNERWSTLMVPYADNDDDDVVLVAQAVNAPGAVTKVVAGAEVAFIAAGSYNIPALAGNVSGGYGNWEATATRYCLHVHTFDADCIAYVSRQAQGAPLFFNISFDGGLTWSTHSGVGGASLAGWPWDKQVYFSYGRTTTPSYTLDAGVTWTSLVGDFETEVGTIKPEVFGAITDVNTIVPVWVP